MIVAIEYVEQLATPGSSTPLGFIVSPLHRLVRSSLLSTPEATPRSYLKEHLGATESDVKFQKEIGLTENHWDAIALAPGKGKSDGRESLDLPKEHQTARF